MRRQKGFTLVELMVVIAIIAVLISILLPVMIKIRYRALVLVSPIAYVGQDFRLYLTGPKGGYSLRISEPGFECHAYQNGVGDLAPPRWSPSGLRLAYWGDSAAGAGFYNFVHEPSTGKVWRIPCSPTGPSRFCGWVDNDNYFGDGWSQHVIYIAETGREGPRVSTSNGLGGFGGTSYTTISPTPLPAAEPYVAWINGGVNGGEVCFVKKNFIPGRSIWRPNLSPDIFTYTLPAIDPMGEYVAVTLNHKTAVKRIRDPNTNPPLWIDGEFCDWTEDGNVLVNNGQLTVYTKEGQYVRTILVDQGPPRGVAAYRKYEHH